MLLQEILDEFLLDCRIRNLSKRTIKTYDYQISIFVNYMESEFGESSILKVKKIHIEKDEFLESNIVKGISYLETERV